MMPISDPQEGFFYPTLTLMMDSYIIYFIQPNKCTVCITFYKFYTIFWSGFWRKLNNDDCLKQNTSEAEQAQVSSDSVYEGI